jgi:hypothetical protein
MRVMNRIAVTLGAAASLVAAGCGSGSSASKPSTTATVGPTGLSIKAGSTTLSIPPNAVSTPTSITVREAEPKHGGVQRVEVEPHALALAVPAKLSVTVNDQNVKLKLVDDAGNLSSVEVEDRNHHQYKTTMSSLGEVEVEEEHGAACTTACTSTQECDDGVCKTHVDDASKQPCDPVCDTGFECDDGACKTHNEFESSHGLPSGTTACTPACATGLECSDGVCKAHGGTSGGGDGGSGSDAGHT